MPFHVLKFLPVVTGFFHCPQCPGKNTFFHGKNSTLPRLAAVLFIIVSKYVEISCADVTDDLYVWLLSILLCSRCGMLNSIHAP